MLLYLDLRRSFLTRALPGRELHTHKGVVRLDDIIGRPYGSRVRSSTGQEFVVLRPTIRDMVLKMRRATQIIYPKDMGLILAFTGIGPGWRVVEG
ncbi:tRNA (adenine-N1)-methyltransferase, partial [Candidatus Bathyarchaeota archaeon]